MAFEFQSLAPHSMQTLNQGLAALYKRLKLIDGAKKSILIESYIFRDEEAGRLIVKHLAAKAKSGVEVKLLIDQLGTASDLDLFYLHDLVSAGIEVKLYNTAPLIDFAEWNHRDHRKEFIVDGEKVIIGGRNIDNSYFDLPNKAKKYHLDRDIYFEGPLATKIEANFRVIWKSKLAKNPSKRMIRPNPNDLIYKRGNRGSERAHNNQRYKRDLKYWLESAIQAKNFMNSHAQDLEFEEHLYLMGPKIIEQEATGICSNLSFISDRPHVSNHLEQNLVHKFLIEEIKKTDSELVIENPYFILDKQLQAVMDDAITRGTKLKILTNSMYSESERTVSTRSYEYLKKLADRGIELNVIPENMKHPYDLGPLFTTRDYRIIEHSKTFIFNRKDFFIGSYNIDPRSAFLNLESGVICRNSPDLSRSIYSDILHRANLSTPPELSRGDQ